MRGRRRSAQCS